MKNSLFDLCSSIAFMGLLAVVWAGPAVLASDAETSVAPAFVPVNAAESALDAEAFVEVALASNVTARDLGLSVDEYLVRVGQGQGTGLPLEQASSCIPPYCCIDNCHDRYLRCEARCGFGAPLCEYACVLEYQNCEDACLSSYF